MCWGVVVVEVCGCDNCFEIFVCDLCVDAFVVHEVWRAVCSCLVRFVYFVVSVFLCLCSVGSCVVVVYSMFLVCSFISMMISFMMVSASFRVVCFCSGLFCICVMCLVVWYMFWCRVWLSYVSYVLVSSGGMNLCVSCRMS